MEVSRRFHQFVFITESFWGWEGGGGGGGGGKGKQFTCLDETVGGYAGIVAENKLRGGSSSTSNRK